jgi:putative membrane protein
MKLPRWSGAFISPSEIHAVVQAVKAAESGTQGEIVPMIVKRSSSLGHLSLQIFTLCCLLACFLFFILDFTMLTDERAWITMGAIVLSWPLSEWLAHSSLIQRLFTISSDREWQVHARATMEFYASGFQNTKNHTGVLIFLSLMERKCVVLADVGIAKALPPETWEGIVKSIVTGIRAGKTGEGLIAAIAECGRILASTFPAEGKHENQIPNQLIIKE